MSIFRRVPAPFVQQYDEQGNIINAKPLSANTGSWYETLVGHNPISIAKSTNRYASLKGINSKWFDPIPQDTSPQS